ncbi:MAG: hypothetical protein ABR564_04900, partial [Candidatus Dormibacteria bacterium]
MLDALARAAHRRCRPVLVLAIATAVVAAIVGGPVTGLLKGGGFEDPASESARAAERLREASGIDLNRTIV